MLSALLEAEKVNKVSFNQSLKKAFEPYSDPIEVAGSEVDCIIVLANLAVKIAEYLDDRRQAKKALSNEMFWQQVLKTADQLHTHNLKLPDARVSLKHRIRVIDYPDDLPVMGWSGNSSDYNYARFLNTGFLWQGVRTSLLVQLLKDERAWRRAFSQLGIKRSKWQVLRDHLIPLFQSSCFPDDVDLYCPQVRFTVNDRHLISISPVVSHSFQLRLQQSLEGLPVTSIPYPHSASISQLCGALGGHIRFLHYWPLRNSLLQAQWNFRQRRSTALSPGCLTNRACQKLYQRLTDLSTASSLRKKRLSRREALRELDDVLAQWLSPLLDMWQNYLEGNEQSYDPLHQAETAFIRDDVAPKVIRNYLIQQFHQSLENAPYTKRYAYHPQLTSILHHRLLQLFKQSPRSLTDIDSSDLGYLVIGHFSIEEGNALNNPYVAGMPSITGAWGFCKYLEIRLKKLGYAISVQRMAVMCHQYDAHQSTLLPEYSVPFCHKGSTGVKRPGLSPRYLFDGRFSLILEYRKASGAASALKITDVISQLPEKLWGGVMILDPHKPNSGVTLNESFEVVYQQLVRAFRTGVWLIPEHHQKIGGEDLLDALKQNYSLAPVLTGFKSLEKPKVRQKSLSGLHCFAEPILGLCRRETMFRLTRSPEYFLNKAFWGPEKFPCPSETIYLVARRSIDETSYPFGL